VAGGREDPRARRGAARGLGGARDHGLRLRRGGRRPVRGPCRGGGARPHLGRACRRRELTGGGRVPRAAADHGGGAGRRARGALP
jgi:hypothetical protein